MPRETFLPFSPPSIGEEEIREVIDTLRSSWITTGPKAQRFESEFAARVGAPAAVGLNSCTAGLHTALVALGIGPGDEVITTTWTFCASVNVIEHVGARPVLVDVEPDTLNLDPARVEAALSPKTKAILPVHFAGHPADMAPLEDLAAKRGLSIIEDAAHALPASYHGRVIGSGKNLTSFSFYATKNLTTAEGGMLTGPSSLLERARVIALHGMNRDAWKRYEQSGSWFYEVVLPGFKYNMTDIAAALGLVQLRKLDAFQRRRHEVAAAYDEAFRSETALELPVTRREIEHARHLYPIRLRAGALRIDRARFIDELKKRKIGASVHFIPVHLHPYYRDKYRWHREDFPVASDAYDRVLSLPLHPGLEAGDVADIQQVVLDVVKAHRR